jgi:hypothetical protein
MKKDLSDIVIILDESGSIASLKSLTGGTPTQISQCSALQNRKLFENTVRFELLVRELDSKLKKLGGDHEIS